MSLKKELEKYDFTDEGTFLSPQKGIPGYLFKKKRARLLEIFAIILVVAIFLILSYVVDDKYSAVMLVMGALSAIPAANLAVNYIVMINLPEVQPSRYREMEKKAGTELFSCGYYFTNDKMPTLPVEFLAVYEHHVVCLFFEGTEKKKIYVHDAEDYLERMIRLNGLDMKVLCYMDEKAFEKKMKELTVNDACTDPSGDKKQKLMSSLRAISL